MLVDAGACECGHGTGSEYSAGEKGRVDMGLVSNGGVTCGGREGKDPYSLAH